jgi:ABC-type cobalamin/Fe3+-siderophores transport system ATPase subunit
MNKNSAAVSYQLRAQNIAYQRDGNAILADVNLHFGSGEMVGLIGPNGAGKSSLLRLLAGLSEADSGQVLLRCGADEKPLSRYAGQTRAQLLAYLAQQDKPAWPLELEHLVGLGRAPWHRPLGGKSVQDTLAVERALTQTDLLHLRKRNVTSLSGGELQRALLARVFAGEPHIIIADEPISALDPYHQLHIMELLAAHAQQGGAVMVALHDLSLAARFCSRLILLDKGKLVADGEPVAVLTNENLEQVYGISAHVDCRPDGLVIIPRKRVH